MPSISRTPNEAKKALVIMQAPNMAKEANVMIRRLKKQGQCVTRVIIQAPDLVKEACVVVRIKEIKEAKDGVGARRVIT